MGSSEAEARDVAEHLVAANLSGHDSHGVGMLPDYVRLLQEGLLVPNQRLELVADHGGVLVFDAKRGFGQAMAKEAMRQGIERARSQGSVTVALRNSAHIGRIGHWAEQCAAAGMVSVHFVNVADHSPSAGALWLQRRAAGHQPRSPSRCPAPAPCRSCCSTWPPAPSPSARPGSPATRACRCPRAC